MRQRSRRLDRQRVLAMTTVLKLAWLSLLVAADACLLARRAPAQAYAADIQTWVAQDALNPPPADAILFVGSSSMRRWEHIQRTFPDYEVIQRGFGGSQFSDLNGYVSQIVLPYDPKAIVVFEGTNDIAAGKSPQVVFQDYLQFVQLVHTGQNPARSPIPIYFIGITPNPSRWAQWPLALQVNQLIEAHAATDPALFYIDVPAPFLATGQPPASSLFVADGLHLSVSGYALWGSTIRAAVSSTLPATRVWQANPQHPAVGARILLDLGPNNPQDGNHSASPDSFGNHWNNWHGIDGGINIHAGQSLGNLITTTGANTGIDLVVAGGFLSNGIVNGGLLSPSAVLLGDFAVATATQDYFYCTNEDAAGGFVLRGLDPRCEYQLRLFGTRDASEVRTSRYRATKFAGMASVDLTTSGAGSGTAGNGTGNDDDLAVLQRLQPNRFGDLFLDVERLAGAFAYLGILELTVTDGIDDLGPGCALGSPTIAMNHPRLAAVWTVQATGLVPHTLGLVGMSFGPATPLQLLGCNSYLNLPNMLEFGTVVADANGAWTAGLLLPPVPSLDGTRVTVQLAALTTGPGWLTLSNGLAATVRW